MEPRTRALGLVTVRADVVTALEPHRAQGGEQLLRSAIVIMRRMATGARSQRRLPRTLRQQPAQDLRPGAMHGAAYQHLDGLQIHSACLANSGKNNLKQAAYFLGDFLLDRFRRFFSSGVRVS